MGTPSIIEQKQKGQTKTKVQPYEQDKEKATPEQLIENAYKQPLKNLGDYIKDFEDRKATLKEQDEVAKRRSGSMRMIAGISDGLAALANLVGVAGVNGMHASNQTLQGASTPLEKRLEAARLERKTDIKDISDRLDAYKAQRDALNLQKGVSLAELEIKREEAQRAAEAAQLKNQFDWLKFMTGEQNEDNRLLARLTHAAVEGDKNRQNSTNNAIIRSQGADGKTTWDIEVDGQNYSFDTNSGVTISEIFNLLPENVRFENKNGQKVPRYGSYSDALFGVKNDPTENQMEAAIGENINNPEFVRAFKARYGDRLKTANGGKPQGKLDSYNEK